MLSREILSRRVKKTLLTFLLISCVKRARSSIVVALQPKDGEQIGPHDVLISRIERVDRRKVHRIPNTSSMDETEYRVMFYTPKKDPSSFAVPCPNYELRFDLTENEYREIMSSDATAIFSVNCRKR